MLALFTPCGATTQSWGLSLICQTRTSLCTAILFHVRSIIQPPSQNFTRHQHPPSVQFLTPSFSVLQQRLFAHTLQPSNTKLLFFVLLLGFFSIRIIIRSFEVIFHGLRSSKVFTETSKHSIQTSLPEVISGYFRDIPKSPND